MRGDNFPRPARKAACHTTARQSGPPFVVHHRRQIESRDGEDQGPGAEYAAPRVPVAISDALVVERAEIDVPVRYAVIQPHPVQKDGNIDIPTAPGLGCDIDGVVVARSPSRGNRPVPGSLTPSAADVAGHVTWRPSNPVHILRHALHSDPDPERGEGEGEESGEAVPMKSGFDPAPGPSASGLGMTDNSRM